MNEFNKHTIIIYISNANMRTLKLFDIKKWFRGEFFGDLTPEYEWVEWEAKSHRDQTPSSTRLHQQMWEQRLPDLLRKIRLNSSRSTMAEPSVDERFQYKMLV